MTKTIPQIRRTIVRVRLVADAEPLPPIATASPLPFDTDDLPRLACFTIDGNQSAAGSTPQHQA